MNAQFKIPPTKVDAVFHDCDEVPKSDYERGVKDALGWTLGYTGYEPCSVTISYPKLERLEKALKEYIEQCESYGGQRDSSWYLAKSMLEALKD